MTIATATEDLRPRLTLHPALLWLAALVVVCLGTLAALVSEVGAVPVLALLAALPMAVVMLLRPELATLVTTFLLYVNFAAILTKQHGLPAPAAGAFILALAFPLLHALVVRREGLRADRPFTLMFAFLGCLLLSTFKAFDTGLAFDRVLQFVLEGLLVYWLILNSVRNLETLRKVFWTVLAAASLLSVLCVYQDVTGSYDQEFGGLAYRNYVQPEDGAIQLPGQRQKWDRAQGPVDEPNRFAQILIVLLPLAGFLYRNPRSPALRWWAAAVGGLTLAGVVSTLSRGAFVTLAVMGMTMWSFRWIRPWHLMAGVLAAAIMGPVISPFFLTRLQSITDARHLFGGGSYYQEADGAIRGRTTEMLAALAVFRDHPLMGVGPAQFSRFYFQDYSQSADIKFRDIDVPRRAHNLYLETAAELGAPGLAVFLVIVAVPMRELWRRRRQWGTVDSEAGDLAAALCLSLVAYLCTGIFLHLSYQRYFWFLLALAGAALQILRAWPGQAGARPAEEREWRLSH